MNTNNDYKYLTEEERIIALQIESLIKGLTAYQIGQIFREIRMKINNTVVIDLTS